jgi:hypothetical protein
MNGKVNQLLTAVRSPITTVEQDHRPPPSHRSRDIDFFALQVGAEQGRQPVTGHELFGHIDRIEATPSPARLARPHPIIAQSLGIGQLHPP